MILQKIIKDRKEYIFEKEYSNFVLYRNTQTGIKECFFRNELAEIMETPLKGRPCKY